MNRYRFRMQATAALFFLGFSSLCLAVGDVDLRGKTKSNIQSQYGQPSAIIGPVGEPPITKWQYSDITVVFEYDNVVHAYRRDYELEKQQSSSSMPQRPTSGDTLSVPQ